MKTLSAKDLRVMIAGLERAIQAHEQVCGSDPNCKVWLERRSLEKMREQLKEANESKP